KVEIPVKLKNGEEEVTVKIPVTIQRDTDGDGIPDKTDTDDDNDGIPDSEDSTPKVPDTVVPGKVDVRQDDNGDVIITPVKPDGTTYKPGTTVTIPGVETPVVIGEDGTGKIPNKDLPKAVTPGQAIITEPNHSPSKPV
ncbi:hypothetical protein, partial [Streptococcus sp. DD10]|uniref:hypothetical protein n=1 Tax=Streptococcus sp. DD10 TaxID=1777878 RepID=UPI000AD37582